MSDVNFYDNDFSEDVGNALFNHGTTDVLDFDSPDSSSDGSLRKRWMIEDGMRILLKGGSGRMQEPFNETLASEIMRRLDVRHVDYSLRWVNDEPFSACPAFTDGRTELVPAWSVLATCEKDNEETLYDFTMRCFERCGLEDPTASFEGVIAVDYVIANEDRHLGNFGLLCDPETLKAKGIAPLYDNGASLGHRVITLWIEEGYDPICRPFKVTHGEQIHLVGDPDGSTPTDWRAWATMPRNYSRDRRGSWTSAGAGRSSDTCWEGLTDWPVMPSARTSGTTEAWT